MDNKKMTLVEKVEKTLEICSYNKNGHVSFYAEDIKEYYKWDDIEDVIILSEKVVELVKNNSDLLKTDISDLILMIK